MKKAELINHVMSGKIICVGQYWSGRVEQITARDQKNGGARRVFNVVRETILTDKDPIIVSRFLGDNEKAENWKPSATRNQQVVVNITGYQAHNGTVTLNGVIEPIE